jgi:hypothetical protein
MSDKKVEIRIAVGKLIELAYEKNSGVTGSILAKAGSAKLTVNNDGSAVLSGSVGVVTFNGKRTIKELGLETQFFEVLFSNKDGMNIGYTAGVRFGRAKVSVIGSFNLEELITSCSGMLCNAARSLKHQREERERILKEVMGG